jgi:hypothetical protein
MRSERLLPLIAAERTLRGLLRLAAGIYLLSHTGSNFGSIANHLARSIELDPRRPFIRYTIGRLGSLSRHEITLFGSGASLAVRPSADARWGAETRSPVPIWPICSAIGFMHPAGAEGCSRA